METHMIFETHAHYDDEAFEADQEEILNSMQECGIGRIVNACASIESLKDTELLMEKYPFVYGAFGIHPDDADKMTQETLDEIRKLCQLPKAVAVGEIGLDYYWHKEEAEHELQKKMFRAQMEIAREQKMPFMIHSREASKGHSGHCEGLCARRNVWWDHPLFFLCKGNGTGVSGYGTLSGNWRCDHIQECEEAEGSCGVCPTQSDRSGDRQSVLKSGAESRETK